MKLQNSLAFDAEKSPSTSVDRNEMPEKDNSNFTFVAPKPNYVIECVDEENSIEKVFMNVCSGDNDALIPTPLQEGKPGCFTVPFLMCLPRHTTFEDKVCKIFDVLFHPVTFHCAKGQENLKVLNALCMMAIKSYFSVKLSDTNIKNTSLKFKAAVEKYKFRTSVKTDCKIPNFDESCDVTEAITTVSGCEFAVDLSLKPEQPKYLIRRSEINFQNFAINQSTGPKELIIDIELPLVADMLDIKFGVHGKMFTLESKNLYHLDVDLPYPVNESAGKAHFKKEVRKLIITLPVLQSMESGCAKNERTSENYSNALTNLARHISSNKIQEFNDYFSKHYLWYPWYNNEQTEKEVVFEFPVPNVENVKTFSHRNECAVLFESYRSSSVLTEYSFYLKFPNNCCIDSVDLEFSSKNILLKLRKDFDSLFRWKKFEAGPNSSKLYQHTFPTVYDIRERLRKLEVEYASKKPGQYAVRAQHMDENEVKVNLRWKNIPEPIKEVEETDTQSSNCRNLRHSLSDPIPIKHGQNKPRKTRSVSESATDDIVNVVQRRGILKMPRSHVRRTMSESSDEITPSSPDSLSDYCRYHSSPDIAEEEYSTEDTEKPKKTVRFLDKVSKNFFRTNSSILGQRKKNQQKKIKNKKKHDVKKAQSDSGNSSCSDAESIADNPNDLKRAKSMSYPGMTSNSLEADKILIESQIVDDNNNSDRSTKSGERTGKKKKSRRGKGKNKSKCVTGSKHSLNKFA